MIGSRFLSKIGDLYVVVNLHFFFKNHEKRFTRGDLWKESLGCARENAVSNILLYISYSRLFNRTFILDIKITEDGAYSLESKL